MEDRRVVVVPGAVIVGAGPSGLAVAACLGARGVPNVVLERASCIASLWQQKAYSRLHLHLPKHLCQLPLMPFPPHFPTYPSRSQFVDYLLAYARHFNIRPVFSQAVESARFDGMWRLTTPDLHYVCRWLVVATGENAEVVLPTIHGMDEFQGEMLHSSQYTTGEEYGGKRVLVVGCGNSGMELCLDLCHYGALPSLVVRHRVHVLPKEMLGRSTFDVSMRLMRWLPVNIVDRVLLILTWVLLGDTTKLGLVRPNLGQLQLNKPPLLKEGELDRWIVMHTTWIKQMDAQCWDVIELGDEEVPKNLPREQKDAAYYRKIEVNAKARQMIFVGLQSHDLDKVKSIPTAKEIWETIIVIHRGSDDMKDNRKLVLQREFHSFRQLEGEKVLDCQARFLVLTDKLAATGYKLEEHDKTLAVIHGMSDKFEMARNIALMSEETRNLSMAKIFGKFYDKEQRDKLRSLTKGSDTNKVALKLSKVLEKVEAEEDEEDDDKEVVLMTKMEKKFLNNKRTSGSSAGPSRDLSDFTCYNCQQKGHLSRNCTNPKVEPSEKKPKKQALLTTSAWGGDEDEEEIYGGFRGICLMANDEQDTKSLERATRDALSKAMCGIGDVHSGMEAAKASERGAKLARGSERARMCSDRIVARAEGRLSRVNYVLSRHNKSENRDVAWLTSLLDGVSMPNPSARTCAEIEYAREPSATRFRECHEVED